MTDTPMVRQYLALKDQHRELLLFFRLGDFYELFFDDAIVASKALDITLTKRGKDENAMPMCGIPFHACDGYIGRLLKQGHKIAICEQVETPEEAKKRGGKSIVRREVVRIFTPGTVIEDAFLPSAHNNFYVALTIQNQHASVAAVDLSTGDFFVETVGFGELADVLSRRAPTEIVFPDTLLQSPELKPILNYYRNQLSPQSPVKFKAESGMRRLCQFYNIKSLDVLGDFSATECAAAGGALEYIDLTQKDHLPHLKPLKKIEKNTFLHIDAASRASLELEQSQQGRAQHGFFAMINKTETAAGARQLAHTLRFPLVDSAQITHRHNQVETLIQHPSLHKGLTHTLKGLPDGARALGRLAAGRGGPRDLQALQKVCEKSTLFTDTFKNHPGFPHISTSDTETLVGLNETLSEALKDEVGVLARDGGFIRHGYDPELDRLQNFKQHSQNELITLQSEYAERTRISSLKIKYNQVIGYFIETTETHKNKIPDTFIHRQSLKNAHRYTTPALLDLQEHLLSADHDALQLELHLFNRLVEGVLKARHALEAAIEILAHMDVIASFANLSIAHNYVRPTLSDTSVLKIQKGRHPTIEILLNQENQPFIANDLYINDTHRMVLLTGPNMGGKSTYLRQNALIIILAQMGCFVPADSAEIGLVDRIFSRVGSGDDLSRGRSTFMMEMMETSTILHQATDKSFVILDEVGRGTSTYDGVAIAQATLEALHNHNKCRTLFATHYHELTDLQHTLSHLKCMTVQTKVWDGQIIFLHRVVDGVSHESYGIHVAKLAGIPSSVTERAQYILNYLETQKKTPAKTIVSQDTYIPSAVDILLKKIDPNQLSPREALDLLFQLKEKQHVSVPE